MEYNEYDAMFSEQDDYDDYDGYYDEIYIPDTSLRARLIVIRWRIYNWIYWHIKRCPTCHRRNCMCVDISDIPF